MGKCGCVMSAEARERIAASKRGIPRSEETKSKLRAAQLGKRLSEETKSKIGFSNMGRIITEETRQRLREAKTGQRHTPESIEKMRAVKSGENNPNFGKHRSEESKQRSREALRGHNVSEETKKKQSLVARHLFMLRDHWPMLGRNETKLLDEQERINSIVLIRQYRLPELGYTVDGYCRSTNTVYEVYERQHKTTETMRRDIVRQNEIVALLGCSFVIIWDMTGR